jgi:hypothetical protein
VPRIWSLHPQQEYDGFGCDPDVRVINFLLNESDHERVLDVVEISFRLLEVLLRTSTSGKGEYQKTILRTL